MRQRFDRANGRDGTQRTEPGAARSKAMQQAGNPSRWRIPGQPHGRRRALSPRPVRGHARTGTAAVIGAGWASGQKLARSTRRLPRPCHAQQPEAGHDQQQACKEAHARVGRDPAATSPAGRGSTPPSAGPRTSAPRRRAGQRRRGWWGFPSCRHGPEGPHRAPRCCGPGASWWLGHPMAGVCAAEGATGRDGAGALPGLAAALAAWHGDAPAGPVRVVGGPGSVPPALPLPRPPT